MRLENLYENFSKAIPERQVAIIAAYRLRRAEDMAKPSTYKVKKKAVSSAKIELTAEEKVLAKLLGLKQKDILALRTTGEATEPTEDASVLFKDSTFEEEDEE